MPANGLVIRFGYLVSLKIFLTKEVLGPDMSSFRALFENADIAGTRGVAHAAPAGFLIEDQFGLVTRVTHLLATATVNSRILEIQSIRENRRASSTAERIVVGRDDPLERMGPGDRRPSGRHC